MTNLPTKRLLLELGLPALILLLLTLVFRSTDLDMQAARYFYQSGEGWRFKDFWLWQRLYQHGMVPGVILGTIGLAGALLGLKSPNLRRRWRTYLFLLLLLAIGPGLLANSIFKENWGRTRPKHVVEFGGQLRFLKVWERGEPGASKSFPSGHASIGFYLMAPYFIYRRHRKILAKTFLFGGTSYGFLMGAGRLAQGAHFTSDIVWAWGMVYLSGLLLCYLVKPEEQPGAYCPPPTFV